MIRLSKVRLFVALFIIRLFNAFTIKTFFQPDEYYQALEPAHKLVFGYGYTTWEWGSGLRSLIHPLLYAAGYYVASTLRPHSDWLIINSPRVVGAAISATTDFFLYRLARNYSGSVYIARWSIVLLLLNPFTWFFSTRAFSSTFETCVMVAGLSYWPWNINKIDRIPSSSQFTISVVLGVVSCIVRPTNAIMWAYFGLHLITTTLGTLPQKAALISRCCGIAMLVTLASTLIDTIFYKEFTFPLYNFVQFNIVHKLLAFYGEAPWHFYIFQALPVMLAMYLPLIVYLLVKMHQYKSPLACASLVMIVTMLLIRHKEIRFIYPIQPLLMILCAVAANKLYGSRCEERNKVWSQSSVVVVVTLVAIHVALAYFLSCVNESGVISIVEIMRTDPQLSVGLLMPCHSTPWLSHMHRPTDTSFFLSCEPPLHLAGQPLAKVREYTDESDEFYADPKLFFQRYFPSLDKGTEHKANPLLIRTRYLWPQKLLFFQPLQAQVSEFLSSGYELCGQHFNSYWHWDSRRQGDILVYCRRRPMT